MPATIPAEPPPQFDTGSFRDHAGRVFLHNGGVYRALSASMSADWDLVSGLDFFQRRSANGSIVPTWQSTAPAGFLQPAGNWSSVLEHERLPVITYPYEWCFGMWRDAAVLQLELLQEALREDVILKDATPFNIQFCGTRPVFIDTGSFTRYHAGMPWAAYRQFCSLFLYPLLLQSYRGLDVRHWLRGQLGGISPADCRRFFSWQDVWRRGLLTHVFLHAAMDRHIHLEDTNLSSELRQQGFDKSLIQRNVDSLLQLVRRLKWKLPASRWSGYEALTEREGELLAAKERFVSDVITRQRRSTVWDLGCNAGRYSRLAARYADLVLAIDGDHATVERLYRDLKTTGETRIVPLCINLADPAPALGWRGRERLRLEDRSRPQLVLCLALIHHLVLSENLLLDDVIAWLRELEADMVLEFVDPSDRQVRLLQSQRTDGSHEYSQTALEAALASRFRIVRQETLPGQTRTLYHLVPQPPGAE